MNFSKEFLEVVKKANNFLPSANRKLCRPFFVDGKQVGLIRPDIYQFIQQFQSVFEVKPASDNSCLDHVCLSPSLQSYEDKSQKVAEILEKLKNVNELVTLRGWRDEAYDVWYKFSETPLLKIERSATCLFGTTQYGVHINGYFNHPMKGCCMWIGKRAKTKQTFPGKLDQMAAGGLSSGEVILECAKRECQEEASLPDHVLENLKPAGCVSYFYEDERGLFPEVEFVFDVEVPFDVTPENADGEVEKFMLCTILEVKQLLAADEFQFSSAVVVLDFLIRHGYITPDNDPHYTQLVEGIHTNLPYGT